MIVEYLFKSFCDFGFPKIIQSDNGTEFVNKVIKAIAEIARIDHRLITPYHPRANGIAERYIQTATRAIRKQLHSVKKSWDQYVPTIQFMINIKIAAIHGSTPFSLMFGRQYNSFQDYHQALSKPLPYDKLKE